MKTVGTLRFRTKCGKEFDTTTNSEGNWEGKYVIGQRPAKPNEDRELVEKFLKDGAWLHEDCVNCKLDKKWREESVCRCKRSSPETLYVIETYCVPELISMPYPKKCPVTGFPFERLVYSYDYEDIMPLYRNDKGNLQTLMKIDVSFDSLDYHYRIVVGEVSDEGEADFENGISHIYPNAKESIVNMLESILKDVRDDSESYDKVKHLIRVFSELKLEDDDTEEDDEDIE